MSNLYNEIKFILKKYGILANKSLGQNFLVNDEVVNAIIKEAQITREDLVIEIGPGLGSLTKELLENAGKVIAIELDPRMINILEDRFKLYSNFEIINEDVLKVNLNKIINSNIGEEKTLKRAKIVANLPYYITTPIIMKLLEERLDIETITVMVQKEVADRLVEVPGGKNTGAITYSVYYYSETKEVLIVPPESFIPEPSVNSEVINFKVRKDPPVIVENEELMFKIIKYAFMQRRKTLINALEHSNIFNSKKEIIDVLKNNGLNEKIRGEALSLEDFANIANYVTKM